MSDISLKDYPYFDLYDRETRYTKVVPYIEGTAQPRDLLEAQSMIQNQIQRLADTIYKNGSVIDGCDIIVNSDKTAISVAPGKVYLDGQVEEFLETAIVPIQGVGLEILGLIKTEELVTDKDDPTLKNPATNFNFYDSAGSYRVKTTWTWGLLSEETPGIIIKTISMSTVVNGSVTTTPNVPNTETSLLDKIVKIIADRDYAQSGNYILNGLKLKLVNHPQYPWDMKQMIVTNGTARIQGRDVVLPTNSISNLPVARETASTLNEPWIFTVYNSELNSGSEKILGQRPVASVDNVVATVLTVDGYSSKQQITRGPVKGGSDRLSETSITDIIAVNQGGTWDPLTEQFIGGVTYPNQFYIQDGSKIDWSPIGSEPDPGTLYSVAYRCRKSLTKQIMEKTFIEDEQLVMGDDDKLSKSFLCEVNDYTGIEFKISDTENSELLNYTLGTDFELLEDGSIDWYNHQVQEIILTRSSGTLDTIDSNLLYSGYEIEQILSVASADGVFDSVLNRYISGIYLYTETNDYIVNHSTSWSIDWSPDSQISIEPELNSFYKVALKLRIPKSSNQPDIGNSYFASYYYWNIKIPGDYLCRDSFYAIYDTVNPARNQLQHYGLSLENSVNFWKSYNYQHNLGNMNKPYPGSLVEFDYNYYLSRYAIINYTSNASVVITLGTSSESPIEPAFDENISGVMLGTVYMPADGLNMVLHEFKISSLKVTEIQNLKNKVDRTEKNLADTWLDMQAKSMPVSNKKGVSTTSFRNDERFDKGWPDLKYAIDPDWEQLALPHTDNFYTIERDDISSTGTSYLTVSTLTPIGVEIDSQDKFTDTISLSPYIYSDQSKFLESQSIIMNLDPPGDFLTIPRISSSVLEDTDVWGISDVSKLKDPSPWFSNGWRGNQLNDQKIASDAGGSDTIKSTLEILDWTEQFLLNTDGNCRRIPIIFTISGGLPNPSLIITDFYLYFGGIRVDVTPLDETPTGSVLGSFRPKSNRSAKGQFIIPDNISAGNVEVKVVSSPVIINGHEWRYSSTSIYNTSVNQALSKIMDKCRCNCYSCNRCTNCWSCTVRCGTGPLSETFNVSSTDRVLRNIEIDFYSVSSLYGVTTQIVDTENGQPTSNTIANNVLGRKYLSPDQLSGAGTKLFTFDDPIYLKKNIYSILLNPESEFNLNVTSEINSGRDIRVKIAKTGSVDLITSSSVNTKPYSSGSFWKSQTGFIWSEDTSMDLKFKASYNLYPVNTTQIVQMESISVNNATAFICTWNSLIPEGTNITFQYSTGNGVWNDFSPFVLTRLSTTSNLILLRALLSTTNANITPFIENKCGFYVQSNASRMYAVTKLFELLDGETADTLDIWIDSHIPSGYAQNLRVSFDNGTTWVDLDEGDGGLPGQGFVVTLVETIPVNLNEGEETYTYHWNVALPLGSHFTSFRTEFNFVTSFWYGQVSPLVPTMSNYIAIPSNT